MIVRANLSQVTLNDADTAAGSTFAGKTTTATGLGIDYMLSKRTALYGRYETNKDEANVRTITGYTAIAGSTNYQATMVGIRHAF
jgi:predicted porin